MHTSRGMLCYIVHPDNIPIIYKEKKSHYIVHPDTIQTPKIPTNIAHHLCRRWCNGVGTYATGRVQVKAEGFVLKVLWGV